MSVLIGDVPECEMCGAPMDGEICQDIECPSHQFDDPEADQTMMPEECYYGFSDADPGL